MAALSLRCWASLSLVAGSKATVYEARGLVAVASLVAEHAPQVMQSSVVVPHGP